MSLRLIIEDYEGETTIVPLNEGKAPVTVGREDNNTIQLTEQNVSRAHARLNFDGSVWALEDLESYNGVRVNGIMIDEPIPLQEGDVIQIGDYRLLLSAAEKRRTSDDALTAANATQTQAGGSGRLPTLTSTELHSMLSDAVTSDVRGKQDEIATIDGTRDIPTQRVTLQVVSDAADAAGGEPEGESLAPAGLTAEETSEVEDEPKSGGKTWMVAAALGLVVAGGVAFQLSRGSGASPAQAAGAPAPDTAGAPESGGHAKLTVDAEAQGGHGVGSEMTDEPPEDDFPAGDFEAEAEPADEGEGDGASPRHRANRKNSRGEARTRRPGLARDLLQKAREASLGGDQSTAYKLAKDSYANNPSTAALQLMGLAACKMSRRSSAKAAYRRMRKPEHKRLLHQVCASNGIDLG